MRKNPWPMVLPLCMTTVASMGVAVTMVAPWYRSDMGSFGVDPLGSFLTQGPSQQAGVFLSANGAHWLGILILFVASAAALLGGFATVKIGYPNDVSFRAASILLGLAALVTAPAILTVLETQATIPLGDGPPLVLAKGAEIGVTLAVVGTVTAWWAWAVNVFGADARESKALQQSRMGSEP